MFANDVTDKELISKRDKQLIKLNVKKTNNPGFPGGAVVKNLPTIAGDTGSSPGSGRSHMPRSN